MKKFRSSGLAGFMCIVASLIVGGCGTGSGGAGTTQPVQASEVLISGTPSTSVTVGNSYNFVPSTAGSNLTFSISGMPSWASFDMQTGTLTGEPGPNDIGEYTNVTITVSDGSASDTLPGFDISVLPAATGAALLSWMAPTLNADNSVLTDLAGYRVRYGKSDSNFPNVKTINGIGAQSYMVENLEPATWYFVVTAFDTSGNESEFSEVKSKVIL